MSLYPGLRTTSSLELTLIVTDSLTRIVHTIRSFSEIDIFLNDSDLLFQPITEWTPWTSFNARSTPVPVLYQNIAHSYLACSVESSKNMNYFS